MTDPHQLLGLTPNADEGAIKRAFRRLAMRWHPDRNPDPAAVEHFKLLRAAYEYLLADFREADEPAEAREAPRGADRRQDLVLTLEEAYLGCEKLVELVADAVCATCDGRGEESLAHTRLCAACHGSGRLRGRGGLVRCGACGGRGYLNRRDCTACGGSGRQRTRSGVSVRVPAGVRGGDELRLAGKGEAPAVVGGEPGDLRLRIVLAPHPLYGFEGPNLVVRRPVSALRLILGGEIVVPMPDGERRIELPPGGAESRELRIEGAGFPLRGGTEKGVLIVELVAVLPELADARLRPLVDALEREIARRASCCLPEVAEWEARWLGKTPPPS